MAVATLLAVAGAALNRTDKDGWTLLLKATLQNEVEWVRLLVLAQARLLPWFKSSGVYCCHPVILDFQISWGQPLCTGILDDGK